MLDILNFHANDPRFYPQKALVKQKRAIDAK
jgi:hypothetical protein